MLKNINITNEFNIIEHTVKQIEKSDKAVAVPTNFMVVIDTSGSMGSDLPQIRTQLKNKLPNLLKDGDTITIVWFSGRNEAGILKEEVEVKSLTTLQALNDAIDKWLKPVGLTAFSKPLTLVKEAVERIKVNRPDSVFALLFMSDGYNNDCSWSDVKTNLVALQDDIISSTFIEYGYYADSDKLSEMAELMGGEKLTTASFDEYEHVFDGKLNQTYSSAKKMSVKVPVAKSDLKFDFAFTVTDTNEIIAFSIKDDEVVCWDNIEKLYYFSTSPMGVRLDFSSPSQTDIAKVLYSAIYLLTDRTYNTDVELIYSVLGDSETFNIFVNSFGKQKLNDYKNLIKECVVDESKRFLSGKVDNLVLDETAYCMIDLINDLTEFDDNLLYPSHPDFNYKRIGQKKIVKKIDPITEDVRTKLANVSDVTELNAIIEDIKNNTIDITSLEFVYPDADTGYPLSNLVWNSSRANLSVTIKFDGYVKLPKNEFGIEKVDTYVYRNYTLIKDGILNVTKLPVKLNPETLNKIKDRVTIESVYDNSVMTMDFGKLPVINRSMAKDISAKRLGELEFELLKLQANKKVYDYYDKLLFPRESEGLVNKYGKAVEEYLKSLGVTDYNGYSPKTETVESTDFYYAVTLDTKISGYSSLPKVTDVEAKLVKDNDPVLKPAEMLLAPAIKDYLSQISSPLYQVQDDATKTKILSTWLKGCKAKFVAQKRSTMQEIAKIKFSLILSRRWFNEFKNFDDNTLSIDIDGRNIDFKFVMDEECVKL